MAALACILHDEGYPVTGSDIDKYIFTQDGLTERGIPFGSFDAKNIHDGDIVIMGGAFDQSNPEIKAAQENPNVQAYWYFDFLGEFAKNYESISVAGTHGKSTTTGLLGWILPRYAKTGYLIGDGHGHMPKGSEYFVFESCEFKRHFLCYHPDYALITNVELDHIDYYKDMDDYLDAFQSFVNQTKKHCVFFGDDPYLPKLSYPVPVTTYGLQEGNDYQAVNIEQGPFGMHFDCLYQGQVLAHIELSEVGDPFLQDALGCFALCHVLGMPVNDIVEGLKTYQGIARRFVIEEVKDSVLIDDYAHHPTEIKVTLKAARQTQPKRLIVVFQPHRYTRTQLLLDEFAVAFKEADELIVTDIYAASEDPIPGISGKMLAETIQRTTGQDVSYMSGFESIKNYLVDHAAAGDLVMTIGAGSINQLGASLVEALEGSHKA